jgi:hypothetical protein
METSSHKPVSLCVIFPSAAAPVFCYVEINSFLLSHIHGTDRENIDLEIFMEFTALRHSEYERIVLGILPVCLCRSVYIRMRASVAPEMLDGLYFYSAFKNVS